MGLATQGTISKSPIDAPRLDFDPAPVAKDRLFSLADRPEPDPVTLGRSGLVDNAASDIRARIAEVPATNHRLVALRID